MLTELPLSASEKALEQRIGVTCGLLRWKKSEPTGNSLLQLWLKSELGQGDVIKYERRATPYITQMFVLLLSSCCHCTFKVVATISRKDSVQEK